MDSIYANWFVPSSIEGLRFRVDVATDEVTHEDAIWFLAQAHQIVTNDSPKTTWRAP